MSINQINNGDSSLTARTIINQVVTNVNNLSTTGTASYAITASYALNGGGGGGGTPGGLNTQIQFNSASTFSGSQYFTYNYQSQSLQQGLGNQAAGPYSHAEGNTVQSIGSYSHAEGESTQATGQSSHAEGQGTLATGYTSHAEGAYTQTVGNYSHAEGTSNVTYGLYSHAEGSSTQTFGEASHAEGVNTTASGSYSHAEGADAQAIGGASHAEGNGAFAIGDYSHAEGNYTKTGIQTAYSASITAGIITLSAAYGNIGGFVPNDKIYIYDSPFDNVYGATTLLISQSYYNAPNTIIELYNNTSTTTKAYILSYANNNFSINSGDQTIPGLSSHTEGYLTQAVGQYSHAEGSNTIAIGPYSHAEGSSTLAIGDRSHAEGYLTQTVGQYSHAEGNSTQTIGESSHAEGSNTKAIVWYSHAEGYQAKSGYKGFNSNDIGITTPGDIYLNSLYGDVSTLFTPGNFIILSDTDDYNSYGTIKLEIANSTFSNPNTIITLVDTSISTTAGVIGVFDDPEPNGADNTAYIGSYSHAEGINTQAIGWWSHAEGDNTKAIGDYSHAEGTGTQAIGEFSHAEGTSTITLGSYSHTEGEGTIASGSAQNVVGKYNTHGDNTSLFIIGNGTNNGTRSDAFKVRQSGSIILPVTSSGTPSWAGTQGEMIFGDDGSGNYVIWAYLGGNWKSGSLS